MPRPQNSWVRKTIRIIAIAANALILVPYAMYVLLIAFNIDCDAWPIVGLGVLCLVAGLLTAIALLRPFRGAAYLIIAVTCSVLQIVLLAHGVVELLDKPDMMTWSEEAMFFGPIILVPVLSLVAFMAHERRWSPPHCPYCGYNLTGLRSRRCPECGNERPDPPGVQAPSSANGREKGS